MQNRLILFCVWIVRVRAECEARALDKIWGEPWAVANRKRHKQMAQWCVPIVSFMQQHPEFFNWYQGAGVHAALKLN
jgi:hypothetical protein